MRLFPTPFLNQDGLKCWIDVDTIVEVAEQKGAGMAQVTWQRGAASLTRNLQLLEGHDLDTLCVRLNEHAEKREAALAAMLTKGTKQLDAMAQVILDTVLKKLTPQWEKQLAAQQARLPEIIATLLPAAMKGVLAEGEAVEAAAADR
jgi:hypothetical protein